MYRETLVVSVLINVVLSSLLSGDFDIADGVKLVSIRDDSNSLEDEARSIAGTPLFRIAKFLHNHELHVRLPNLIEKDKVTKLFSESLKAIDESYKEKNVTGRGSKGDGGGSLALLGLMFAKTVGAAGIGGLGLLTMKSMSIQHSAFIAVVGTETSAWYGVFMTSITSTTTTGDYKALAVSAMALMLSAIIGVKKLTSNDDHDDHQVIYAGHHGSHRRRRDTPLPYQTLPYQGWVEKRD